MGWSGREEGEFEGGEKELEGGEQEKRRYGGKEENDKRKRI
jgi:hypothetical protein